MSTNSNNKKCKKVKKDSNIMHSLLNYWNQYKNSNLFNDIDGSALIKFILILWTSFNLIVWFHQISVTINTILFVRISTCVALILLKKYIYLIPVYNYTYTHDGQQNSKLRYNYIEHIVYCLCYIIGHFFILQIFEVFVNFENDGTTIKKSSYNLHEIFVLCSGTFWMIYSHASMQLARTQFGQFAKIYNTNNDQDKSEDESADNLVLIELMENQHKKRLYDIAIFNTCLEFSFIVLQTLICYFGNWESFVFLRHLKYLLWMLGISSYIYSIYEISCGFTHFKLKFSSEMKIFLLATFVHITIQVGSGFWSELQKLISTSSGGLPNFILIGNFILSIFTDIQLKYYYDNGDNSSQTETETKAKSKKEEKLQKSREKLKEKIKEKLKLLRPSSVDNNSTETEDQEDRVSMIKIPTTYKLLSKIIIIFGSLIFYYSNSLMWYLIMSFAYLIHLSIPYIMYMNKNQTFIGQIIQYILSISSKN